MANKFIDLFCGIGGFHQALFNLGFECVFASDIDEKCRKSYSKNYGIIPHGDITKIDAEDIPSFDVLCAGFPCQPFSKAGLQKGFEDSTRGSLFFDICRIADHHKPKYMILENVRNLATHDKGHTWDVIKRSIDELGYYTYEDPLILNTLFFGVPQNRERVVILCKRKDLGSLSKLPEMPKKLANITSIDDIIVHDKKYTEKYKVKGKFKDCQDIWNKFIKILIDNNIPIPKFPIWTDWWDSDGDNTSLTKHNKNLTEQENKDLIECRVIEFYIKYTNWIDKNKKFYKKHKKVLEKWLTDSRKCKNWHGAVRKFEWQAGDLRSDDSMNTVLWTARGSGIRVKRLDYTPTLVAMSMIPVYGPESRLLTPRELANLQSFSRDFIIDQDDKAFFKQVGNAVNVTMIQRCAEFLILNKPLFV